MTHSSGRALPRAWFAVTALGVGSFSIVTAELAPIGLLSPIASDLGVFHEIAGEIPDYRAPDDEDGWLAAVQDYARPESAARRAQRERLAGFSPVTWAEHFAQVDAWIDAGFPPR